MTFVFCLSSHGCDQPGPAKLSATSTKEETEKVKLTRRPHSTSHMGPDLHCGPMLLSKLPADKAQSWRSVSVCPV